MQNRVITLTHEQANMLACYILLTTNHRHDEAKAWHELAKELNSDGTPKYKNAQSNGDFYEKMDGELEEIRKIIEASPWVRDEKHMKKIEKAVSNPGTR